MSKRMTVNEAAGILKVNRWLFYYMAQQGKLPFVTVVEHKDRNTYVIDEERLNLYKQGKL